MTVFNFNILADNVPCTLHRIVIPFSQRRINIEKLFVHETKTKGISRFKIVVNTDEEIAEKVSKKIGKINEVLEVRYDKRRSAI